MNLTPDDEAVRAAAVGLAVKNTDGVVTINKTDLTERRPGLSGMPAGRHMMLGKRELRDLVEFLAGQKQK
ncbi:MAG: hypothetical protein ACKVHO_26225 [Verrucomicrobiia bacterium]